MIKPSGVIKLVLAVLGVFALAAGTGHAATADRGIELVTEPGGGAYENRFFSADPDGSGVYYEVVAENVGPAGVRPDGMYGDQFAAMRGSTSWSNKWLSDYCPGFPNAGAADAECSGAELGAQLVSAGEGRIVISSVDGVYPGKPHAESLIDLLVFGTPVTNEIYVGAGEGVSILSRQTIPGPADPWGVGASPNSGNYADPIKDAAASPDQETVVFPSPDELVPAANGLGGAPLLYVNRGGSLSLVSRPEAGASGQCGVSPCEVRIYNGPLSTSSSFFSVLTQMKIRAVSDDGQKVFFATNRQLVPEVTAGEWHAYVNDGGDVKLLSDPADGFGRFEWASTDGAFALIVAPGKITRVNTTDLSKEVVASSGLHFDGGLVWASDDTAHVLFISQSQLADAPAGANMKLYLWRQGQGVKYVGPAQGANTFTNQQPILRDARGTADGSVIVFATRDQLLPEDTNAVADLYRYAGDELTLLTPRSGARAASDITMSRELPVANGFRPPLTPRALSDNGDTVFFATTSPLVAEDRDGTYRDVYSWSEANGIELITPEGAAPFDMELAEISSDGGDVFVVTNQSLTPSDRDGGEADIYTFRSGEIFEDPYTAEVPCQGDACQGAPSGRPREPRTASDSMRSSGNVKEAARSRTVRLRMARRVVARGAVARLVLRSSVAGRLTVRGQGIRPVRVRARQGANRLTLRLRPRLVKRISTSRTRPVRARVVLRAQNGDVVRRNVRVVFGRTGGNR